MSSHDEGRPQKGEPALNSTPIKSVSSIDPPAGVLASDDALTETAARRLTTRIQLTLGIIADNREKVLPLIREAKDGNAHEALGYRSWTEYVSTEFADVLPRLTQDERQPIVAELSAMGMSTRAIAPVVGASQRTVANDIATGEQDCSPDDYGDAAEVADFLVMADATKDEFETALTEARSQDDLSRENVISILSKNTISKKVIPKKVSGIDGKSYTRPEVVEPRKPRRSSFPDAYRNAVEDLDKAARRLEKLHADDRFLGHREDLKCSFSTLLDEIDAVSSDISGDIFSANTCNECGGRRLPRRDFGPDCEECGGAR